jgi:hypothetical protein
VGEGAMGPAVGGGVPAHDTRRRSTDEAGSRLPTGCYRSRLGGHSPGIVNGDLDAPSFARQMSERTAHERRDQRCHEDVFA